MKKRLAKKIEKMRRKKIHEALEMVLEINTTHAREQSVTGNKPTAFFTFNGHINGCLDIRVYPGGTLVAINIGHSVLIILVVVRIDF